MADSCKNDTTVTILPDSVGSKSEDVINKKVNENGSFTENTAVQKVSSLHATADFNSKMASHQKAKFTSKSSSDLQSMCASERKDNYFETNEKSSFPKTSSDNSPRNLCVAEEQTKNSVKIVHPKKSASGNKIVKTNSKRRGSMQLDPSQVGVSIKGSPGRYRRHSLSPVSRDKAFEYANLAQNSLSVMEGDTLKIIQTDTSFCHDGKSPSRDHTPRMSNKKRNSLQQGLLLDASSLHRQGDGKRSPSPIGDTNKTSTTSSLQPSPVIGTQGSRLSPQLYFPYSRSPSKMVDTKSEGGSVSENSAAHHSSSPLPTSGRYSLDISGLSSKKVSSRYNLRRMSSPAEAYQHSSTGIELSNLKSSYKLHASLKRGSLALEDVHRTSLPYIPSTLGQASLEAHGMGSKLILSAEPVDEGMCYKNPKWSSVCGTNDPEQNKELNDETCRSTFGMVFCGLCFILFLWYLVMVYRHFINKALSSQDYESLKDYELAPITEVVVHIAVPDGNIVVSE